MPEWECRIHFDAPDYDQAAWVYERMIDLVFDWAAETGVDVGAQLARGEDDA